MTERDLFLAKTEVERRVGEAAEERRARRARREAEEARSGTDTGTDAGTDTDGSAFGWLLRLVGAR